MNQKHHFVLTKRDRERMEVWIKSHSQTEIAKYIGCHRNTISHEVTQEKRHPQHVNARFFTRDQLAWLSELYEEREYIKSNIQILSELFKY